MFTKSIETLKELIRECRAEIAVNQMMYQQTIENMLLVDDAASIELYERTQTIVRLEAEIAEYEATLRRLEVSESESK